MQPEEMASQEVHRQRLTSTKIAEGRNGMGKSLHHTQTGE